jgi:hypothetical protein
MAAALWSAGCGVAGAAAVLRLQRVPAWVGRWLNGSNVTVTVLVGITEGRGVAGGAGKAG